MKQPTMNEDIAKYPVFLLHNGDLIPAPWVVSTDYYNHYSYQLNHFVRKSIRKNSPEFYSRIEHLHIYTALSSDKARASPQSPLHRPSDRARVR